MYHTIQKTIVAWAFNHYIAYYYFDNVNVSQLKVAFEKGEVELENLPIKKDALQHFNLPMEVISGVVGRLSIKVPLMTMLTDPWIIKISNLMLIVAPKKHSAVLETTVGHSTTATSFANESSTTIKSNQSQLDSMHEQTAEANFADYLDNSNIDYEFDEIGGSSEENKLAEFYSSFSSTVSKIVKDIYKNIKIEVDSITILFEDFESGLAKFSCDYLLMHRPKSVRNITMRNVSIYLANIGLPENLNPDEEDLIRLYFEKCNLDVYDEASNNMQIVAVTKNKSESATASDTSKSNAASSSSETISETKIEGNFEAVLIEQLARSDNRFSEKQGTLNVTKGSSICNRDGVVLLKRNILQSDKIGIEFKLNNNSDGTLSKSNDRNLHLKLDLIGMQYIHSQRIYEVTKQRLKNLFSFIIKLQRRGSRNQHEETNQSPTRASLGNDTFKNTSTNKLFIINIEEGLLYIIDDTSGSCAIPLLEFSLEDCRVLQFSGRHQQNGLVYAKIGCSYYNREVSTWEELLKPWPFNFSWDHRATSMTGKNRDQIREMNINSEDLANFVLTGAFLDLVDVALKRVFTEFIQPKPIAKILTYNSQHLFRDLDTIFVLHNDTGHRLHFATVEHNHDLLTESFRASPNSDASGDTLPNMLIHKISISSRSSIESRESPNLYNLARWKSVDVGESISFQYDSLPIYRRHIGDHNAKSRVILLRVEGWKTLAPLSIDKTGIFFRDACSDRVLNEDSNIVISISMEESSVRKIISVRGPLNLVNNLDATVEIHFVEANQALYIKPNSQMAVPLPYIFNKMHIRTCSVGATMSEKALVWDDIKQVVDLESRMHVCDPITVTNHKHASYCTSKPYRICVLTQRDRATYDEYLTDIIPYNPVPVYTITFIPPLTVVNLLPCKMQFSINDITGIIAVGSQYKVYHIDTTKPVDIYFKMPGFPTSKPINIDPSAGGSFHHSFEMFDKRNRSLYLDAKIIFASTGAEPAIEVIIYAPYWLINKTRLPLVFKQDGAASEAAGQFKEHEESPISIMMFSFYDTELEPPWLCSMRLGKSKGVGQWSDSFKLEKGSGERRLCSIAKEKNSDAKTNKSLIDINVRRGFGRYSKTMIVTFTERYGFDPLTKTPKKLSAPSPQNYRLASYNHNVNLAERIADHAVNLFNTHQYKITSDISFSIPGFKLSLVDKFGEKLIEACVEKINIKCKTKAKEQILDCSIQEVRINNIMSDCENTILLDRASRDQDDSINVKPAVRFIMDRILGNSFGTTLFRQVQLSMCELVLNIEEKLILKLVEFISFRKPGKRKNMNNLTSDIEKMLNPEEDRMAKYYFDLLRIDLSSLKLSVFTATALSNSLQKVKSLLGLKFFSFEDAQVQLAPYFKMNVTRTFKGVFDSVTRFYRRQILEQAPRIVGQQIQNYLRFHLSDLLSTLYDEVYHKLFN